MIDHHPSVRSGRQAYCRPAAAPRAVGYAPDHYNPQYSYGPMYPPSGRKAPGWFMIVLATSVMGILAVALTINRAAEARNMGLSTRRYWVAWAIPCTVWAALLVYLKFVGFFV